MVGNWNHGFKKKKNWYVSNIIKGVPEGVIFTTIPERHQIVKNQGFKLLNPKKKKKKDMISTLESL